MSVNLNNADRMLVLAIARGILSHQELAPEGIRFLAKTLGIQKPVETLVRHGQDLARRVRKSMHGNKPDKEFSDVLFAEEPLMHTKLIVEDTYAFISALPKSCWVPQSIATGALLWALYPGNPYGYYILLRFLCCGIFIYFCISAIDDKRHGLAWTFAFTALIYNPVFRIHLTRPIWSVLNIATIILAWASAIGPRSSVPTSPEDSEGTSI